MMIELTPEQWMNQGLCRGADPGEFFPSDGVGVEAAQRVCSSCPVKAECLEYALRNRIEHGVWGGASERQRRRILRGRKLDASASEPTKRSDEPTPTSF